MRFSDQSDLERAVGGAAPLRQLLDKNGDNQPDQDLVEQSLDAGSNELASYIQAAVELESLQRPYPLVLVLKAADASAFYAWRYGAYGQPIPDNIVQAHEAAVRWAQDVGARRATLGVSPKPSLDPPAELVDPDPCGNRISIKGFRKCYR
jgi:phage gp36-like protein